jgi:hypothetical protein
LGAAPLGRHELDFLTTEPPIRVFHPSQFYTDAELTGEHNQRTAKQVAFQALTTGTPAARLVHALRTTPPSGNRLMLGAWFVADHDVNVFSPGIVRPFGPVGFLIPPRSVCGHFADAASRD